MDKHSFCLLSSLIILISHRITVINAEWTLSSSTEFPIAGEDFTLTCDPQGIAAVFWKKLDIDTSSTGTSRAVVELIGSECRVGFGYDLQYQYTCESGPIFKLTIPANVMTNSQNNIRWRCGSIFGGAAAEYTVTLAVPVNSVSIQGDSNYPALAAVYENTSKTFTCITNGCRPKANITVTTTGVAMGQRSETLRTQIDGNIVTTVTQTITATRGGDVKTLHCSAVNLQGRQPVSQTVTLEVYYVPPAEPTLSGYTTGTVLYEDFKVLTLTCQQSGGYPLSTITWSCERQTVIPISNGTVSIASSYVQITVDRNITGKTCTCTVRHPYITTYTRTKSLTFTVFYPPTTPTLQIIGSVFPWIENTEGALKCTTVPGNPPQSTYEWLKNGQVITQQTSDIFIIPILTSNHNGLHIQCRVSNAYTVQRPPAKISDVLVLDVQFSATFDPKEEPRKPRELHKNATININFYSNPPAEKSDIKWINRTSGNQLTNSGVISLRLTSTQIKRSFYGKSETLNGQSATLSITPLKNFHLGHYILMIKNGGNLTSLFNFEIIKSAPPDAPSKFTVVENKTHSVILTWERGNSGGHPQTFVIRYTDTITGETQEQKVEDTRQTSNYTAEITGIKSGTTYLIWIYSTNIKGNSSFDVKPIIAFTLKESEPQSQSGTSKGAVIGGVVGAVLAVIIIVLIITVIIIYRRRNNQEGRKNENSQDGKTNITYEDIDNSITMSEVNAYQTIRMTENEDSQDGKTDIKYEDVDNSITIPDVNAYQTIRKTDSTSAVFANDANAYDILNKTKIELETYETLNSKNSNDEKVYVNTTLR